MGLLNYTAVCLWNTFYKFWVIFLRSTFEYACALMDVHRDWEASWEIIYAVPTDELRYTWVGLAVAYQGLSRAGQWDQSTLDAGNKGVHCL